MTMTNIELLKLCKEQADELAVLVEYADRHITVDKLLASRIAELEAERRWIPCTERLPDEQVRVLTHWLSDCYDIDVIQNGSWYANGDYTTHWMPLPKFEELL